MLGLQAGGWNGCCSGTGTGLCTLQHGQAYPDAELQLDLALLSVEVALRGAESSSDGCDLVRSAVPSTVSAGWWLRAGSLRFLSVVGFVQPL